MNRFNTKGKKTFKISEVVVGDIVKFKGTRNGGIRRILEIYYGFKDIVKTSYFSKVLQQRFTGFSEEPYTSTNSVDKLSHIFREGTWFKVIKD